MYPKNFSIGVDIEDIGRFRNLKKDDRFVKKIFSRKEIDYCFSKKNPASHLAARYVGKEAVVKALNTFVMGALDYRAIEIINNKNGAPVVKINGKKIIIKNKIKILISLSHCQDKAVAMVTIL